MQKGFIDLLGEVVAQLIQAVDGVLGGGERGVRCERVAGLVLAVPEIEVGAMLVEDKLLQRVGGRGRRPGGVMAVGCGEVVKLRNAVCVQHVPIREE